LRRRSCRTLGPVSSIGLDWNPIGKPKSGHEAEFDRLFRELGALPVNVGFIEKARRRIRGVDRDAIDRRWREIQVTPYETLQAPRVGTDSAANEWALARYANRLKPEQSEAEFLQDLAGYYVLQLVPRCDGLPWYSNGTMGYVELFSFRAQFLRDCEHIIGSATFEKCYVSTLAPGLAALGHELRAWATSYSARNDVTHVEAVGKPEFEDGTPESNAHILFSAARWCEYWSNRGHGMEAYW
jgi:hypothetical protein